MLRVLITGASGFVGRAATPAFASAGWTVRTSSRTPRRPGPGGDKIEHVTVPNGLAWRDWVPALDGVACIVHLAGAAHARHAHHVLQAANVGLTTALLDAAGRLGVRRFVYLSSVKAVGEDSGDDVWTEGTQPTPTTPYGASKLQAEQACAMAAGLETIVLRSPLVISYDAQANLAALLKLAALPIPLPLGGLGNRRSMISRHSLVERLLRAAKLGAPTGVFFVADDPPISTSEIVMAMRRGLGARPGLWPAFATNLRLGPLRQLYGSLAVSEAAYRKAFPETGVRDCLEVIERAARTWRAPPSGLSEVEP